MKNPKPSGAIVNLFAIVDCETGELGRGIWRDRLSAMIAADEAGGDCPSGFRIYDVKKAIDAGVRKSCR